MRELPLTLAALVAIGVTLVIALGGYFGVVAPRRREIVQLEQQLNAASTQIATAPAIEAISPTERARWREVEASARDRLVARDDQRRRMVEIAQVARAAGLTLTDLQLEDTVPEVFANMELAGLMDMAVAGPAAAALTVPPNIAVNPRLIRLVARHRHSDLVDFLDRIGRGTTYVALYSLDVRRVENHLESDIRLASLRWAE